MENQTSAKDTPNAKLRGKKPKSKNSIISSGCDSSESSSHTHFFRKPKYEEEFQRIQRKEYFGYSESISGSSDTFRCIHGPEGKKYTEKGRLKRNLVKELDPLKSDPKWTATCAPTDGWDTARILEFLVTDPVGCHHVDRLDAHIKDLVEVAEKGYRVDILDSLCTIVDYLVESLKKKPSLRDGFLLLLQNMKKPILLAGMSDAITYFGTLQNYIGFLGYLLMRLEEDEHFDLVSESIMWQLTAPNKIRPRDSVRQQHVLMAAVPVLYQTASRMLAVTSSHRFPTFLNIAVILACDSSDNCIELMKENIIENVLCRFNPYFPEKQLLACDMNPAEPVEYYLELGDSSRNMTSTLTLLLVLLKSAMKFLEVNPNHRLVLPTPSVYAQRCFIWVYRYECNARDHRHERNTLTVITSMLLYCFGDKLTGLSTGLMPDIMCLAVLTEVITKSNWTQNSNINTSQLDVYFKKCLIQLSAEFLKKFQCNKFMIEHHQWLLGLMYLVDPGLCGLRLRWSHALYEELRRTALQAVVVTLPLTTFSIVKDCGIVRRVMWYIEWYSESPYELHTLYWCVRLLQVAISTRDSPTRPKVLQDIFESHGIIILMRLCKTLVEQKTPPVEKSQVIIALCLRLLTSAVKANAKVDCCVYPHLKWPSSVNSLANTILDLVLFSLDKHFIISDRLLISLLNFIWEAIIWRKEYRNIFVSNEGIYKLLDLITMTRPPVQCLCLAIVCDVARAGDAVGQLVTWRARLAASDSNPKIVKRGATIASLLAAAFREDCGATEVELDENGIIQNLDYPLMSKDMREEMNSPRFREAGSKRTPVCLAAADMAGSRKSKAFALLQMLSEDLAQKVSIADETYNLYKNIKINPKDEAILVLCSHYLTIKQNETWMETKVQSPGLLPQDEDILDEFLHINKGWGKEIKTQQEHVIKAANKRYMEEECSLYTFLGRVRLGVALDALREVRCIARSSDRERMMYAMLHDAVFAHQRRSLAAKAQQGPILRTYTPPLDDQNMTGQCVKVFSILPRNKPKPRDGPELSS